MTVFLFYFICWIESTRYLDNYAGFYFLRYQFSFSLSWPLEIAKVYFRYCTKPRRYLRGTGEECDDISATPLSRNYPISLVLSCWRQFGFEKIVGRCVVFGCENTKEKQNDISILTITFYGDSREEMVKTTRTWISFASATRKSWTASKDSLISSVHFAAENFTSKNSSSLSSSVS